MWRDHQRMVLPLPFCLFFMSPYNFYRAAFLRSSVATSCTMLSLTTLPGATPEGSKQRGISIKLQSRSTRVAIDFSILPTVSVYSLPSLYLLFILLLTLPHPILLPPLSLPSLFYYKKFQNRMKRSASSSKENMMKGCFSKKSSRQERPTPDFNLFCQQTLAEYHRETHPWQTPDFYKTFAHNKPAEASRPESKQALRKGSGRPETSKGVRPSEKSLKMWQQESKMGCHSYYVGDRKQHDQGEGECVGNNIEIIVTQSNRKCGEKKIARSKFETDLDDEFLQLFAN